MRGSGPRGDRPVRPHDGQLRGLERLTAEQVAAEVADVRGAVGGDDHVVGVAGRDGREVGMGDDASVVLAAQHGPVMHRHHEQAAVRQPAQAARPIVDLEFDPGLPVGADGHHVLEHEVGEPQPVVVPARSLAETEPIEDEFQASGMRRGGHGGTLARPPPRRARESRPQEAFRTGSARSRSPAP